jgi:hypothetical protein
MHHRRADGAGLAGLLDKKLQLMLCGWLFSFDHLTRVLSFSSCQKGRPL